MTGPGNMGAPLTSASARLRAQSAPSADGHAGPRAGTEALPFATPTLGRGAIGRSRERRRPGLGLGWAWMCRRSTGTVAQARPVFAAGHAPCTASSTSSSEHHPCAPSFSVATAHSARRRAGNGWPRTPHPGALLRLLPGGRVSPGVTSTRAVLSKVVPSRPVPFSMYEIAAAVFVAPPTARPRPGQFSSRDLSASIRRAPAAPPLLLPPSPPPPRPLPFDLRPRLPSLSPPASAVHHQHGHCLSTWNPGPDQRLPRHASRQLSPAPAHDRHTSFRQDWGCRRRACPHRVVCPHRPAR